MEIINKLLSCLFVNKDNKQNLINQTRNNARVGNYDEYMTYKSSNTYPNDFVVFDFETTGLSAKDDNIIQIGAIRYKNNEKIDVFNTYVNPRKPIPSHVTEITGIRNKDVKNAPMIVQVLPKFLDFIGSDVLIAHNARFDMKFLLANLYNLNIDKSSNEVIDTLSLSRKYIKSDNGSKLPSYKLEILKNYLNINVGSHNALDDCLVCAEVYKKCKENINISKKPKKEKLIIDEELSEKEIKCFNNVKEILQKNDRSLEFLKSRHTGNYYDVVTFYTLVRIKLKGRKQYILSKYSEENIKSVWKDAVCEAATKSETGTTRILFKSPDDLYKLEPFIVKDFDGNMESLQIYRTNVGCGEENVQEYLRLL